MKLTFSCAVLFVLAVGCAPKQWSHPLHVDETQTAKDRYECMQETSYASEILHTDHGDIETRERIADPEMFSACMEARGYERTRGDGSAGGGSGWALRAPAEGPSTVEVEVAGGTTWLRDYDIDVTVVDAEAGTTSISRSAEAWSTLSVWPALGFTGRVHRYVGLNVRLGLRAAPYQEYASCSASGCGLEGTSASPAAPFATLGARVRLPPFQRMFLHLDLGIQPASGTPGVSGEIEHYDSASDTTTMVPVHVVGLPATVMPFLRTGVGFDLAYAEPFGVSLGFAFDISVLRDLFAVAPYLTVTARWSPRPAGER